MEKEDKMNWRQETKRVDWESGKGNQIRRRRGKLSEKIERESRERNK